MSDPSLPRPKGETNAPKRAHELFGVEIQFSWLEQLLGFLDRFSATERSEYVALLQANVSEKRPSALYPKYKFHKTLEAQRVWNFAEEQALGAGWRDRLYQPGEEETPDEPPVEVKENLHKSRSQLLQELLDWHVLRARSIADSHDEARDLKSIPTNLIFSAVWLDRQAKTQKAQNAETMSDEYQILSKVDYHTRIDCAKLRPELVDVLNVAEYVAALEDVERRNAPPPSLAELSLAEQKRNNAIMQELLEIQKRSSAPPPQKEEVPIEDPKPLTVDPLPPGPGKKPRKKQKAVIIDQIVLKAALEQLNSKKGNLRIVEPRELARQLARMGGEECPSAATWLNVLNKKPRRQDVVEHLVRFFKIFGITVDKGKLIAKHENE